MLIVPYIAVNELTVTTVVAMQPAPPAAKVIIAVPLPAPVTMPVPGSTLAIATLPLVHMPAPEASANATVAPGQIAALPLTGDGSEVTETVVKVIQPVPTVYVIVVVPTARPITAPEPLIVATEVLLLPHEMPPVVASER